MNVLVTGGGGFIGRNLVAALQRAGHPVTVLARGAYPSLSAGGVRLVRGDLTDAKACAVACEGAVAVFHAAALATFGVRLAPYVKTNIEGTQTLLAAAARAGVQRFIFTSSPSVAAAPAGHAGTQESAPLVTGTQSPYAYSKARAEELVRAADTDRFRTVAVRPHLVWGPGDSQFSQRLVERARSGTLKLIGDGSSMIDPTYIDNCVDAHLQAERALANGGARGQAYFIANGEPLAVKDFLAGILKAHRIHQPLKSIPAWLAYWAGAAFELSAWARRTDVEPPMTRFLARKFSTPQVFDLSAARRDLGYAPRVSVEAGLQQVAQSA